MTREITDQLIEPPSHVFLQGGVGGMAASVVAYLRQHWGSEKPRIVIVEPELAPCLFESARNGDATTVKIGEETVMAGLSCGVPSDLAWEVLSQEVDDFITIPDAMVAPTMRMLAQPHGDDPAIEAGESAVAGLAALIASAGDPALRDALRLDQDSSVLLVGSEGVTDSEIFSRILRERTGDRIRARLSAIGVRRPAGKSPRADGGKQSCRNAVHDRTRSPVFSGFHTAFWQSPTRPWFLSCQLTANRLR